MSDDKKVIFSMSWVSKTYQSTNKQVLKNIYLSFFYGAKIGILGLNGSVNVEIPPQIKQVMSKEKVSILISNYQDLKKFLNK